MTIQLYEDDLGPGVLGVNPESALIGITPSSAGIGLGSPAKPPSPRDMMNEEIGRMSGADKIFAAMGEFGAGIRGKPSPLAAKVETQRKEKLLQMEELKGSVSALEHGVKLIEGMEGPERQKFIESYAKQLNGVDPELGASYRLLADRPDILSRYKEVLPLLPEHIQLATKVNPKFLTSAEGVKAIGEAIDTKDKGLIAKKLLLTKQGYLDEKFVPKEVSAKFAQDGVLSQSELLELQQYLPEGMRLNDKELTLLRRDPAVLKGAGILAGDAEQSVLADRAKREGSSMKPGTAMDIPLGGTDFAKGIYDPDKTLFPDAEHDKNGFAILGKGKKEGTKLEFPPTSSEIIRMVDGKQRKFKVQIGADGKVQETDLGEVAPPPKEPNPIKDIIRSAVGADGKAAPKPAPEAKLPPDQDVRLRFNQDAAMKSNKLGAKTAQGFEVKNASGKVIGYYK